MKIPLAQILRNLVAVAGLGLFGLSVARLLWPDGGAGHREGLAGRKGESVPHRRADATRVDEGSEEDAVEAAAEIDLEEAAASAPSRPEPAPADSGELVIVLDPGHGGSDPGSVREGHYEKNINLAVAKRIRNLLEEAEVKVVMTRTKDVSMELQERVAVANQYRNSLFVSIHQNASVETSARGVETYFAWPRPASVTGMQRERYGIPEEYAFEDERGQLLATKVQDAFCKVTKAVSRGVKNRNFVVIRWVHGPAVLVECGFLSNATERSHLLSDSYQDKVARGVADGILEYVKASDAGMWFGLRFPGGTPEKGATGNRRTLVQSVPADS